MKHALAILSSMAWLQHAAAACCRSNQCLKALVQADQGAADCSTNLVLTFTPEAITVTETTTQTAPGEPSTSVGTQLVTITEAFTASTETVLVAEESTVTASTETQLVLTTQKVHVLATETVTETVTVGTTVTAPVVWRRLASSAGSAAISSSAPDVLPTYAIDVCSSWDKYLSACKCLGASPTTTTAETPSTTVTVEVISTLPNSLVSSLIDATTTELAPVTITTTTTQTSTVSVTVTTLTTQTTDFPITETETKTTTTQITSTSTAPAALLTKDVGPFRINASDYNNRNLYLSADPMDGEDGAVYWENLPSSTAPGIANNYIWKIDSDGHVRLALPIPPYNYDLGLAVGFAPGSLGSLTPNTRKVSRIVPGPRLAWVKGAVDPVTKNLYFEAAGRKNILFCGNLLILSAGLGEDLILQGASCVLMHPRIQYT